MRKYELKINDRDYDVTIKSVSPKNIHVEVNGKMHIVEVQSIKNLALPSQLTSSSVSSPKLSTGSPVAPRPAISQGGIIAPMPGQIKSIFVREGDKVTVGQKLLIMEAMKLENKIAAKTNGIVKKIMVRDGDTVNQGQELVIIE
jgi:biotin carboxyl carrier protein